MTEAVRIKKNSFYSLISIASRLFANVIVFWLIARVYGPEKFGTFTFSHTTATILILLADFGFDILLTTELSKNIANAKTIFENIFNYKIIFSFTAFLIMISFGLFLNNDFETKRFIYVFSFFLLFTTLTNFSSAAIRGFERFSFESIVSVVMNLSLILLVLFFVIIKSNLFLIAIIFTLTRIIGFLIASYYLRKLIPNLSYKLTIPRNSELQKKVMIFGFNLLFTNLVFQQDTLLISLFAGNKSVGLYQAVFKLIVLPLIIPELLNFSLLPVLSRYFENDKDKAIRLASLMYKFLFITAFPIFLVLYIYPAEIIHLIYGTQSYEESIPILRIFALNIFVRFVFETFALILTTSNRQIVRMYTVISASILNLILNIIFLPKYGIIASAYIALITIIFIFTIYTFYSFKLFREWFFNRKNFIIITISLLIIFISRFNSFGSIYLGASLIIILFAAYAIAFFFNPDDKKLIFNTELKINVGAWRILKK